MHSLTCTYLLNIYTYNYQLDRTKQNRNKFTEILFNDHKEFKPFKVK